MYNRFEQIIFHNLSQTQLKIEAGTLIGSFQINSLQKKSIFLPFPVNKSYFDKFAYHKLNLANFEARRNLSDKICKLLKIQNESCQAKELEELHSTTAKQIYVTKLVRQANINPDNLPRNSNSDLIFCCRLPTKYWLVSTYKAIRWPCKVLTLN